MFRAYDKKSAIKEIQRFIYKLSDYYSEIPRISIDGIYGDTSRRAVMSYQSLFNLPADGIINNRTHESIYSEYLKITELENSKKLMPAKNRFPLKRGDSGNDVLYLNMMLDEFRTIYGNISPVRINPLFSYDTEKAVREIRELFSLDSGLTVDSTIFSRMENELDIHYEFN